jgi:hypothetical protein
LVVLCEFPIRRNVQIFRFAHTIHKPQPDQALWPTAQNFYIIQKHRIGIDVMTDKSGILHGDPMMAAQCLRN